jgi:hypothetical protein
VLCLNWMHWSHDLPQSKLSYRQFIFAKNVVVFGDFKIPFH